VTEQDTQAAAPISKARWQAWLIIAASFEKKQQQADDLRALKKAAELEIFGELGGATLATVDGELVAERVTADRPVRGYTRHVDYLKRAGIYQDGQEAAAPRAMPGLASCGHPADEGGECSCSYWPERAPAPAPNFIGQRCQLGNHAGCKYPPRGCGCPCHGEGQ
jgi:hypothetical protein